MTVFEYVVLGLHGHLLELVKGTDKHAGHSILLGSGKNVSSRGLSMQRLAVNIMALRVSDDLFEQLPVQSSLKAVIHFQSKLKLKWSHIVTVRREAPALRRGAHPSVKQLHRDLLSVHLAQIILNKQHEWK